MTLNETAKDDDRVETLSVMWVIPIAVVALVIATIRHAAKKLKAKTENISKED